MLAFTCPFCARIFLGIGPVPPHPGTGTSRPCPGAGEQVAHVDCEM